MTWFGSAMRSASGFTASSRTGRIWPGREARGAARGVEDDEEHHESVSGLFPSDRIASISRRSAKRSPPPRLGRRARGPGAAELGQERVEEPRPPTRGDRCRAPSGPSPQRVEELFRDTRRGALHDLALELRDGGAHVFGHLEREACREFAGAEHPDGILAEPDERIADRLAHDAALEILDTAHEVEHGVRRDVVEEPVDGEVAAEGVFLGGPERVVRADERRPPPGPVRPARRRVSCGTSTTFPPSKRMCASRNRLPMTRARSSRRAADEGARRMSKSSGVRPVMRSRTTPTR